MIPLTFPPVFVDVLIEMPDRPLAKCAKCGYQLTAAEVAAQEEGRRRYVTASGQTALALPDNDDLVSIHASPTLGDEHVARTGETCFCIGSWEGEDDHRALIDIKGGEVFPTWGASAPAIVTVSPSGRHACQGHRHGERMDERFDCCDLLALSGECEKSLV